MQMRRLAATAIVLGGLLAAGAGCGEKGDAPSAPGSRFSDRDEGDTQDSNIYKTLDKNLKKEDKEQKQDAGSE